MKTQRFDEYLLGTFRILRVCLKNRRAFILRGLSQMVKEEVKHTTNVFVREKLLVENILYLPFM